MAKRGLRIDHEIEGTISVHEGMNDHDSPWLLKTESAAFLENMEIDKLGERGRRRGVTSIGALSEPSNSLAPGGMWTHFDKDKGKEVLLGSWNQNLYILDGTGLDDTVGSGISLTHGLHTATQGWWEGQRSSFIFSCVRSDSDASAASLLTGFTADRSWSQCASMAPRWATFWQYRTWCFDNTISDDNQTLHWSDLNEGLNFKAVHKIQVEPGVGGKLVCGVPIRNTQAPQMLVFKERAVFVFTTYWGSSNLIPVDADELDFTKSSMILLTDNFGCVSPRTVQYIPGAAAGEIIFLAHDGFRAISRGSDDTLSGASLPLSHEIQSTIERINFDAIHQCVSVVWDRKYHCAVPLDGAIRNTHIITYDLFHGSFSLHSIELRDVATTALNQTTDKVWFQLGTWGTDTVSSGPATGWHAVRGFHGNRDPDDSGIVFREDSRGYTMGQIQNKKRWDWLAIEGFSEQATAVVSVLTRRNNDSWVFLGDVTFPKTGGVVVVLGDDALPWESSSNGIFLRKIGLADIDPSYTLQIRLTQTSASDYAKPTFVNTSIAAKVIEQEFDNETT